MKNTNQNTNKNTNPLQDTKLPIDVDNESIILANALHNEESCKFIFKKVDYKDFRTKEFQVIAYGLQEVIENKLEVNPDAVLIYAPKCPVKAQIDFNLMKNLMTEFPEVKQENIEEHINVLKLQGIKAKVMNSTIKGIYKDCLDPSTNLDKIEKDLDYLKEVVKQGYSSVKLEFKDMVVLTHEYEVQKKIAVTKRSTGYRLLDNKLTEGFKEGQITTIAGLSGSGKSSFTLSCMNNLGNRGTPTAQFALEMPNISLMHKLVAFNCDLPISTVIRKPSDMMDDERAKYNEAIRMLRNKSIFLNDEPSKSLSQIKEQIILLQEALRQQYIVVSIDLFGKIKELQGSDNFARDYEKNLNYLQQMTRELGIHMIIVAQINRAVSNRKFSRPKMSDLKNAGALAEVSDLILGIHRPFYDPEVALKSKIAYGDEDGEFDSVIEDEQKDLAEVIILKQRMGEANDIVNFIFSPNTTRFLPIIDEDQKAVNSQKFMEDE